MIITPNEAQKLMKYEPEIEIEIMHLMKINKVIRCELMKWTKPYS